MDVNGKLPEGGKGSYVIILNVSVTVDTVIGKLGPLRFAKGYYAYTGSAMGPGGLAARVGHHLKRSERPHWHLDYFREFARVEQVWYCTGKENLEHAWAGVLKEMAGSSAVAGFGCSDCKCRSHLFRFARRPGIARFRTFCKNNGLNTGSVRKWVPC